MVPFKRILLAVDHSDATGWSAKRAIWSSLAAAMARTPWVACGRISTTLRGNHPFPCSASDSSRMTGWVKWRNAG